MRKLGIAILVIVVLVGAATLIVPHMVNVDLFHDKIQAELEKRLARKVTLGTMHLSMFPPSFRVENTTVADDPVFNSSRPLAMVEKLSIGVEFWPLLHKELKVTSLRLDRPHIELVRDAQGVWNFATLGHEAAPVPQPTPATSTGAQPKEPGGQFSIAKLFVNDGQVAITDVQKRQPRAVYDHIDLDLKDFAPDKPFSLKLTAHLPGAGKQTVMLQGKGGPIQQADLPNTPFDGTLRMDQVSTGAAQKFLNSQSLNGIDAVISGDAKITNSSGKLASSGSIRMEDTRIRKVNVGYPITLNYDVADDFTNGLIQIRTGNIKLGATPVTVAGTIHSKGDPAQIDLKVTAENASIQEMARLASAFGVAFDPGMEVKGRINADIQARGPMNKPAMNGQVSARNLDISGKDLPQPVHVNDITIVLTPDSIRSNDFAATTGSTSVNANFTLTNYSGNNSTINAAVRAPNAKMSEIFEIARATGVSAVKGVSGSGTLNLDVRAQGQTRNLSALNITGAARISNAQIGEIIHVAQNAGVSAVNGVSGDGTLDLDVHAQGQIKNLSTLNFSGTGKISNANLKLPSLPKPIQVRNSDIQFSNNSIVLQNVAAGIEQTNANGALTLKNFDAPQVQLALKVDGKINEILELARTAGVSAVEGMSGDGSLNLDLQAQGPVKNMSAMNLSGTGKISNASLKLPAWTKPLQVHNSDIQFSKNSVVLQNVAAGLGQTNANGALTLRNFDAPQVQFTLNLDKVNVNELQQMFNAAPAQPAKRAAAAENNFWSIVPKAEAQAPNGNQSPPSLLTRMTGGGTVNIGTLQYDELLLNNAHSNVILDHGLIKLNPTTADLYGGKESGSITLDLRPAQPVYMVNLKSDKVDANKLVSSVSDLKQTIYGMLASNVNASFSSSSANAIARSLNGSMAINLTNGKLMNLDLLHELAAVGKFVGGNFESTKNFTNVFALTGNFDVKNGVAQTNNLNAAIDGGTLAAAGLVSLADQSLNLHVTAVLNQQMSQQVGGTQVGGYMNTALENNKGELVLPVIVTGTFQHPHVTPDLKQIAQMKLKNMLPNTRNPAELTTGILGAVVGGKNQGGTAGQPAGEQSKGGLGGILDAIGGKKPQQGEQPQSTPGVGTNQDQQPAQQQQSAPATGTTENQPESHQGVGTNQGQQPAQQQQQGAPATGTTEGQPQSTPTAGANQGQQPEATPTPTPTPGWGDVLNKVLNRKKKDQQPSPTPTPTPTPQ